MRSSYKLIGLCYRQLSARRRLVSSATSNASYGLRYWETQLGKTTLSSNGTVVAKKTVSSAFNISRSEDFPCTIDPDATVLEYPLLDSENFAFLVKFSNFCYAKVQLCSSNFSQKAQSIRKLLTFW